MRLNLFTVVVSHFIVMTTCILEQRKNVVLHFDSEDTLLSSDNLDVKVKTRVFRSTHQGRKLSMWGNFMSK
jgi:hypothetical protein